MCLVLTLQRGDFCCFPFSSCAFPGTRRTTEDPGGSPRDQEISVETRRFSQGLGDSLRVWKVFPGSRRSSQDPGGSLGSRRFPMDKEPCSASLFALLLLPHITPNKSLILSPSPRMGKPLCPSPHNILGFTSSICCGRAELALWLCCHCIPGLCSFLEVSWHPLLLPPPTRG